jgi:hypothetical protein
MPPLENRKESLKGYFFTGGGGGERKSGERERERDRKRGERE